MQIDGEDYELSSVRRNDFHHNFLKRVIVRLDFQGVLESEMEKVLVDVKPFAREQGFSEFIEKRADEIDIAVVDKGIPESVETTNSVRRRKVYSFTDEKRGFVLNVSNNFICLTINTMRYIPFEEYSGIVPLVANIYKENIDFFTVIRFGIRKINECLIENKSNIQRYFDSTLFNYYNQIDGVNTIQSNHTDIFDRDNYHINLISKIAQGKLEEKTVYSVRLDIDAYLNSKEDILVMLDKEEKRIEINELIFEIYTSALTDDFMALLQSDEDFDNGIMMGVERND